MSSSTSSSEHPSGAEAKAKRFLLCLAVGVLSVEAVIGGWVPVQKGRHEVDRRVAEIERIAQVPPTVFLSDSISYEVLMGVGLPEDVLDLSSNQTIGVAGNYFLLRRLLERAPGQVERVVYAFSPLSLSANLDSKNYLKAYFETVFLRADEIDDIEHRLGRKELSRAMEKARLRALVEPPSSNRAGVIRDPLGVSLRDWKRTLRRGGPVSEAVTPLAQTKISEQAGLRFRTSAVTDTFLPALADLCAAHGIELVLVTAPVAPSIDQAWRENGFWEEYETYLGEFEAGRGAVTWIHPCPFRPDADGSFYDGVHLEELSKGAWGRALLEIL